jgi:hypothetical protein
VVAAVVLGVVDDGTAVEAVVGVTLREGLMLAFVTVVGLRALADRCGVPLPLGLFVTIRAITTAKAARVAPMITIPLCLRGFVSACDSGGIGIGSAESLGSGVHVGEGSDDGDFGLVDIGSEAFMAETERLPTTGESDDEALVRSVSSPRSSSS